MEHYTDGMCWEFIENCPTHLKILEECKKFKNWKEYNSNSTLESGHPHLSEKLKKLKAGVTGRWFTKHTEEHFPTFMEWYDKRFVAFVKSWNCWWVGELVYKEKIQREFYLI